MKESHYSETQIIKRLKEVEEVRLVREVCLEHGVSDATYDKLEIKHPRRKQRGISLKQRELTVT